MEDVIGYINNKAVYFDKVDGYLIEESDNYLRTPTHKEIRQIKAKFGDLEKKCLKKD